jgi:hypothetical protein
MEIVPVASTPSGTEHVPVSGQHAASAEKPTLTLPKPPPENHIGQVINAEG